MISSSKHNIFQTNIIYFLCEQSDMPISSLVWWCQFVANSACCHCYAEINHFAFKCQLLILKCICLREYKWPPLQINQLLQRKNNIIYAHLKGHVSSC